MTSAVTPCRLDFRLAVIPGEWVCTMMVVAKACRIASRSYSLTVMPPLLQSASSYYETFFFVYILFQPDTNLRGFLECVKKYFASRMFPHPSSVSFHSLTMSCLLCPHSYSLDLFYSIKSHTRDDCNSNVPVAARKLE